MSADYRDRLSKALVLIQRLRAKLEQSEARAAEPIAIIGMGARFPGGDSPDRFWRDVLEPGVDAVGEFPRERADADKFYDPDPNAPGKAYVMRAGYVGDVAGFDAGFFGISPREAIGMDPQQRIALEVAWEALENAGIAADRLSGSRSGVFMGASTNDYVRLRQEQCRAEDVDAYQMVGESAFIAGRIAYTLGLMGPAEMIDTACSSSLVAAHHAVRALRAGDIDLALAGGVNLILNPFGFVLLSKTSAISPNGRCATFDAGADGYTRGEGCGVVVLKRLADARRDGDRVLATIRGTAVNHDGKSSGLTVPNVAAQEAVIRDALRDARVTASDVDYVEAHGTGTQLGDPIELRALENVLGAGRSSAAPLLIGSVKTNVGHLEAAAGIAGLIKVVLAMVNERIPSHLHFETPNPNIRWDKLHLSVTADGAAWPADRAPVAGVSSFGAGGTNAHMVLAAAEAAESGAEPVLPPRTHQLLTLSAKTESGLRALAGRYARFLADSDRDDRAAVLADVCATANTGRARHRHRLALVAVDADEAVAELIEFSETGESARAVTGAVAKGRRRVGFAFPGQGAQFAAMGRELYQREPAFKSGFDRAAAALEPHLGAPIGDVVFADDGAPLTRTEWTQPAVFAVEFALAELWKSVGVTPRAVVGHSVGEFAAAVVAGALSLEHAAMVIAARARLMQALPEGGAMVAASVPESVAREVIDELGMTGAELAAVNSPSDVVVAGDEAAVAAVVAELDRRGARIKPLRVSHAFHTARMEPMMGEFRQAVERATFAPATVEFVSTVTGERIANFDADYFCDHARRAVRFGDGIAAVVSAGIDVVVEVGPGRTLASLGRRTAPEGCTFAASLRDRHPVDATFATSLGELFVLGLDIDFVAYHRGRAGQRMALPTYPFERKPFWFEAAAVVDSEPNRLRESMFELSWEPVDAPEPDSEPDPCRTLVFADRCGVAAAFGADTVVTQDDIVGGVDLAELASAGFDRIVVLTGLDAVADDRDISTLELVSMAAVTTDLVAELTRELARTGSSAKLWIVTRGAQSVGDTPAPIAMGASTVWGLGRVVALEHPANFGGLIDLDPSVVVGPADTARTIRHHIATAGTEDQIALRDRTRYGARLRRSAHEDAPLCELSIDGPGAVLITGGMGGLGLEMARYFAERGATRIALTTRKPFAARETWDSADLDDTTAVRIATFRDIESLGCAVDVFTADVADRSAMTHVVETLCAGEGGLRGVVHAAGISEPQNLVDVDLDTFHKVTRPKVEGTWIVHELTRDLDLDFFALFSSIASVWGSQYIASYAAANHFLDAVAHHRRALGLPATSINWGPWMVESHLADDDVLRFLESVGLAPFAPAQGLDMLGHLIATDATQMVICGIDWSVFKPIYEARGERALLEYIEAAPTASSVPTEKSAVLLSILEADAGARLAMVQDHLVACMAKIMMMDAAEIDADVDIAELGVDSMMVMDLVKRCRNDFAITFSPKDLFECTTIAGWAVLIATAIATENDLAASDTASRDVAAAAPDLAIDYTSPAALATLVSLAGDIRPTAPASMAKPGRVLLTGATGFVGAFTLRELLDHSDAVVDCLVRADDVGAGIERIRAAMARYELTLSAVDEQRIGAVPGDLSLPNLGMNDADYRDVSAGIGAVLHVGASVNFTESYHQAAPANVAGTEHILRLCCGARTIPLHYVSTYGLWGIVDDADAHFGEDDPIESAGKLINGYVQTKWVAEKMVHIARDRGLPVNTYRLGRVMGHSHSGAGLTTAFTCAVIKSCIQLGLAPELGLLVEMTPVDFVARTIAHLTTTSTDGAAFGHTTHVVNESRMRFSDLVRCIERRGYDVETVPPRQWMDALAGCLGVVHNELHPVLDAVEEVLANPDEAVTYGTTNLDRLLRGSGIACPTVSDHLVHTYFDYYLRCGFLAAPADTIPAIAEQAASGAA